MTKKIIRSTLFSIMFCLLGFTCYSQKIATLEVSLPKPAYGLDIPVSTDLDAITYIPDTLLSLIEINGKNRTAIPFQIVPGNRRTLHWIVTDEADSVEKHVYELVKGKADIKPVVTPSKKDGTIVIHKGDQNLLQYYFRILYPPEGVDTAYKRSGFIHPLWSPRGQVLTRIQPPDHYHHYGIWNPWTQVEYEGDKIDFWNLNSKQGTVRFANFVSVQNGPVFAELGALHEHIVFIKNGGEKVALNEIQRIRVYSPQHNPDLFIVDFNISYNTASESPFKILEYRYAGLGWRTTEKWDKNNSMVLTSEGKTRKDADGSKARWCIVQGEIADDYAGVVMMSYPTNYNFPEPLRIWPEDQYNRGDMFANFCPTKNMDWVLNPGKKYVLRYRFLVYNDRLNSIKAENAWQYFAYPPEIKITKY
jgi:hypothetical protein